MGSPLGCILKNGHTTRAGIAYGLRKNHAFSAPMVDETIFATKVISTEGRYPVLLAISITKGSCHKQVRNSSIQPIMLSSGEMFIVVKLAIPVVNNHMSRLLIKSVSANDKMKENAEEKM
ncbi:hypothetical protein [Lawsonibacter sp. JLR.KK007]|uniref:hypothetical protein n=1 Tax=Lawsonibacter sp. JLR.KK007 TaxID=3114293 RepID=UPI002FF1DF14